MSETQEKLPYEIERWISEEQQAECDNNQAYRRPTPNAALANIRQAAIAKYHNYQAWLTSGSDEEQSTRHRRMRQCAQVHEHFEKKRQGYTGYSTLKPKSQKLEGIWVLAPLCLTRWDDVLELEKIFQPEEKKLS